MIKIIFLILGITFLTGCSDHKKQDTLDKTLNIDSLKSHELSSIENDSVGLLKLSSTQYLKIDSLSVSIDKSAILDDQNSEYSEKCSAWSLSEDQIINIFKLSKKITGSEMHDLYYDLPCRLNGKVIINAVSYKLIINGGSFIYLYNSNEKIYLGCSDEKCKKYFLTQGGDPKRDLPDD